MAREARFVSPAGEEVVIRVAEDGTVEVFNTIAGNESGNKVFPMTEQGLALSEWLTRVEDVVIDTLFS